MVVKIGHMRRRQFLWCLVAMLMPACFSRAALPAGGPSDLSPQALVQAVTTDVLSALREHGGAVTESRAKLVLLIQDRVVPYFDFRLMAVQVLGYHWRRANESQRQQFTEAFRQLLTNTYAAVFGQYNNQRIEVLAAQDIGTTGRVSVPTRITAKGEPSIRVDYRLYRHNGKWQVYDVVVDGISLLINYRSEYSQALQRDSLDSLIDKLKAKNAEFLSRSQ